MRVLLVNAPPARIVERMYDTPEFTRLALACLGAVLRERGHQVAAAVKRRWPSVHTIVGGVHVSALPAATLEEFPAFDFGCVGEGELTLAELVDVLEAGGDPTGVAGLVLRAGDAAGLVLRGGGRPVRTAPCPLLMDLDDLPMPAWDLMPPGGTPRRPRAARTAGHPHHHPGQRRPWGGSYRKTFPDRYTTDWERFNGRTNLFEHPSMSAEQIHALRKRPYIGYRYRPRYAWRFLREVLRPEPRD